MPDKLQSLEDRIDKLLRYLQLLDQNIQDLKEQIETRYDIDKAESIIHTISRSLKRRKNK